MASPWTRCRSSDFDRANHALLCAGMCLLGRSTARTRKPAVAEQRACTFIIHAGPSALWSVTEPG